MKKNWVCFGEFCYNTEDWSEIILIEDWSEFSTMNVFDAYDKNHKLILSLRQEDFKNKKEYFKFVRKIKKRLKFIKVKNYFYKPFNYEGITNEKNK